MNQRSALVLTRYQNATGTTSWRVSGRLNGIRVRKNFKTREEAAAEKTVLELKALQATSGLRSAVTRLTDDQLHEAESVFRRLQGQSESLTRYVDFALTHYRAKTESETTCRAAEKYLAVKKLEFERRLLSDSQYCSIRYELTALLERFPQTPLSEFTPEILNTFLERGHVALKTYNNRRGVLSTFFKFALKQDWIEKNPVERTPHHRIRHWRGSAETLSADTAAQLMAYVETYLGGILVPYFALCLFAGIRPCILDGEITRLRPESVRLDTGVIHIEPQVAKVRMKRLITIQPNLTTWLHAYPLDRIPIIPVTNGQRLRKKVFEAFKLSHDVLRHTYISMFVAKFRSIGEASIQAGNSETIIRRHYLDLKTKEEGERFFNIMPKQSIPSRTEAFSACSAPR